MYVFDFIVALFYCTFVTEYRKKVRVVAQPGSALAWGASGRWFESSPPDLFLFKDS
jgi:hypothetical protein